MKKDGSESCKMGLKTTYKWGEITLLSRVASPQLPIYQGQFTPVTHWKRAFLGVILPFITIVGAHLVWQLTSEPGPLHLSNTYVRHVERSSIESCAQCFPTFLLWFPVSIILLIQKGTLVIKGQLIPSKLPSILPLVDPLGIFLPLRIQWIPPRHDIHFRHNPYNTSCHWNKVILRRKDKICVFRHPQR